MPLLLRRTKGLEIDNRSTEFSFRAFPEFPRRVARIVFVTKQF